MHWAMSRYIEMMRENSEDVLSNPDFFETRYSGAIKKGVRTLKPIVQFSHGMVKLGFNVGTRGNGVNVAKWPEDLGERDCIVDESRN